MSKHHKQYIRNHKLHHLMVRYARILIFVLFLLFWEIGARAGFIETFFFSSPGRMIDTIIELMNEQNLFHHLWVTFWETLVSFFLVMIIGIMLSSVLWYFPTLSEITEPFLVIGNSIPKSALAPLFLVWFGASYTTIIVAGAFVAFFGSVISMYNGFQSTPSDYLILIRTLGGKKKDMFLRVILPYNVPVILCNMKINIGLSLVGVIIGEFLASRSGLGYLIIYGSQVFNLDLVITCIVILCLFAVLLYASVGCLEHIYKKEISPRHPIKDFDTQNLS